MRKRRPVSVFFTAVLLIVLYFALFPYPLGREMVAKPAWAIEAASAPSNTPSAVLGAWPFQLGDSFGYVTADGTLLHVEHTLFQVALTRTGYINYTRVGTDWIMRDPLGARMVSFSGTGYPLLSAEGSRILVVNPDLTGVLEVDRNGDTAWARDFPAVLTSVSFHGDYLLAGLLNGSLQLLNRNGVPVYQGSPGSSRVPVIYGCAVGRDGSFIASVSGIGPQLLTVLGKSGSTYAPSLRIPLPTDYRREVRIGFSPDSRYLYYEMPDAVGLLEPTSGQVSTLSLRGTLAGSAFLRDNRLAAFASRDGQRVGLRLVSPFLTTLSAESFSATELFLGTVDGELLLGLDGRLLRVDIEAL
ncbi:MAG: hypothetical protein ABSG17_05390 [Spirochaetia bacterium]|jgi:hypothetical protein